MAVTETSLPGNGTAGPFTYTFPALEAAHIKVSLDNVAQTVGVNYSLDFVQKQITFLVAPYPTAAQTIRIYRETDDTALEATFYSGAAIRATDLNNNFNQALYVAQETSNNSVQDVGNVSLNANYTFNGTASGQTPTANSNFATKQYVDDAVFASGNLTVGNKGDITVNSANSWEVNNAVIDESNLSFTPLKPTDIGVTVQAYDADTVKTDVAQTFTAQQTFTGGLEVDGAYKQTVEAVAALDIDCSTGNYFTKTINGNSTFTVSNVPASSAYAFTLELTHTSGTVTWFTGVEWPKGTVPTLTTGKTHLFIFVTDDGGSRWRGSALVDYVN